MQRIGLLGGSFNPVTIGHLLIAQAAVEELALDRLVFIPAAQSPFKPDFDLAPAPLRLRMLRLALAGQPKFGLDDQEIQRGGVSYTVDTLRLYRQNHPAARLYYLVGADHAAKLPQWREPAVLADLAEFVICARPGEAPPQVPPPFRGHLLGNVPVGFSASLVRARIAAGLAPDGLVPPAVAEVLRETELYKPQNKLNQ